MPFLPVSPQEGAIPIPADHRNELGRKKRQPDSICRDPSLNHDFHGGQFLYSVCHIIDKLGEKKRVDKKLKSIHNVVYFLHNEVLVYAETKTSRELRDVFCFFNEDRESL